MTPFNKIFTIVVLQHADIVWQTLYPQVYFPIRCDHMQGFERNISGLLASVTKAVGQVA